MRLEGSVICGVMGMKTKNTYSDAEVGFDIPALPGMDELEIQTPCLVIDLDRFGPRSGALSTKKKRLSSKQMKPSILAAKTLKPLEQVWSMTSTPDKVLLLVQPHLHFILKRFKRGAPASV